MSSIQSLSASLQVSQGLDFFLARYIRAHRTDPGHYPSHHHLDPLHATSHQNRTGHYCHTARQQGALSSQSLRGERSRDGPKDSADIVQRRDRGDHDGGWVSHLGQPVRRDHHAGHDPLVVAEQ